MEQEINAKAVQFSDEIKAKVEMTFNNLMQNETALIENLKKDEFYIKMGVEAFEKLLKITKAEAEQVWGNFNNFNKNEDEEIYDNFITTYPNDKTVLNAIYTFVAYCDFKASKKQFFNQYEDKRVMAEAGIYQNAWIPNLLKFLINKQSTDLKNFQISKISTEVSPGVKNAIKYFSNSEEFLPIISEPHRKLISKYFFGKENLECDKELIQCFNSCISTDITKQENKNYLYVQIIYDDILQEEWNKNKLAKDIFKILKECKNIILTGAPGTGKTFLARENIANLTEDNENKFFDKIEFVQFHPTYDYTDFVEGLRPKNQNGNIVFEREDGIFKRFCKEASKNTTKNYLFIIDEINRGDISKIFGELFFAIDPGYRGEKNKVQTQYQTLVKDDIFSEGFYIPNNVYIIGTMNDIDRSVESLDFAFRRRFAFKEISVKNTQKAILNSIEEDYNEVTKRMDAINNKLKDFGLSEAYYIGAAYFAKIKNYSRQTKNKFESLWDYHLKGVLYEYFRGEADANKKLKELKKVYDEAKPQK